MEKQVYTSVQRRRILTSATLGLKNNFSLHTCACGEASGIDGYCSECRDRQFSSPDGVSAGLGFSQYYPSLVQQKSHSVEQATTPGTDVSSRPLFGHNFSHVQVHAALPETIQTKPVVNQPGDTYEQEADQVAEQVSSASAPSTGDKLENDKSGRHRKGERTAVSPALVNNVPPMVRDVSPSPRQSLDTETRMVMGPGFGHDFSQIPVHATVSRPIQAKLRVSPAGDKYEQEADQIAEQVMRMPSPETVQRDGYSGDPQGLRIQGMSPQEDEVRRQPKEEEAYVC